jgi:hypothetical protein
VEARPLAEPLRQGLFADNLFRRFVAHGVSIGSKGNCL